MDPAIYLAIAYLYAGIFTRQHRFVQLAAGLVFVVLIVLSGFREINLAMTGLPISVAAIYHLANANTDALKLLTYPQVTQIIASHLACIGLVLVAIIVSFRRKASHFRHFTPKSQTIVASVFSATLVIHNPAIEDVRFFIAETSLLHGDSIGLEKSVVTPQNHETLNLGASMMPARMNNLPARQLPSFLVIFGESLESSFFDARQFPSLTPQLHKLGSQAKYSNLNILQVPYGEWTIAGMHSSLCGAPLVSALPRNTPEAAGAKKFFCVGDVFQQLGYKHLIYTGGADSSFAGKVAFYINQGFTKILGKHELQAQKPNAPLSKWGIFDDDLFEFNRALLSELLQHDEPFLFVTLTLDTHPPSGHETPRCREHQIRYEHIDDTHLHAIKCADYLLAEFIQDVLNIARTAPRPVYVILISDHLMMASKARNYIRDERKRSNIFFLWESGQSHLAVDNQLTKRLGSQFDVGATLLDLATDGQVRALGFGRSLLAPDQPTLREVHGDAALVDSVKHWTFIKNVARTAEIDTTR